MRDLLRRQPLVALLAFAVAALVVAIGIESGFGLWMGPRIPEGFSKRAPAFEARLLPPFSPVDADSAYPEMVARPLFISSRRPAPQADLTGQGVLKRDQYVLQGVTIAGDTRIALLREIATGRVLRVEKGRDVNGVTVAEVNPESVTLAAGKDQEVLQLLVQKVAPGAASAPLGPFGAAVPAPGVPQAGIPVAVPAANPLAGGLVPNPEGAPAAALPLYPTSPQAAPAAQGSTPPLSAREILMRRREGLPVPTQ